MASRTRGPQRGSNSGSECSATSDLSGTTAPTFYSSRHSLGKIWTSRSVDHRNRRWNVCCCSSAKVRLSSETYASTLPSKENILDEDLSLHESEYVAATFPTLALPSTPQEFAEFIPSTRRLLIRHDDTVDGNMNLRIDAEKYTANGNRVDLTLFHLRMHDLKRRDFSLRRYCRGSGREVCHSRRKFRKAESEHRPGFPQSMSNAIANLYSKSEHNIATTTSLQRQDSGYETMSEMEVDVQGKFSLPSNKTPSSNPLPTNTMNIEFSNYAHVDLERRGAKSTKRYEFEYWGTAYTWKRVVRKDGNFREVSYHLYYRETSRPIAYIVPIPMSPSECHEEETKGGWIPASSMWICDEGVLGGSSDVAEVIVASGLMALVDDCIKSRWHRKNRFQFPIPMPVLLKRKINLEYVGPKRLINEVFHRRGNTITRSAPPLRQNTANMSDR